MGGSCIANSSHSDTSDSLLPLSLPKDQCILPAKRSRAKGQATDAHRQEEIDHVKERLREAVQGVTSFLCPL